MADQFCMELLIEPVAQPRPRIVTIRGRGMAVSNPRKHPITAYKARVQAGAIVNWREPPLEGPLGLKITFVMPRSAGSHRKREPRPREWHTIRPDVDNLKKGTLDALKGIVFVDDSQICHAHVAKVIAAQGEEAKVKMVIYKLPELP